MAATVSLTLDYDALLSTTMMKYSSTLVDNVTQEFILYYTLRKAGAWKEVDDIGERASFPLMYDLGNPDSYEGYDQLDVTPMDGLTSVFFDWRQASVPISISGKEELQNRGEERILNLLETKIEQAELGIKEWFSKSCLQGEGMNGGSIETARVSPSNGSSFIDPLPLLVKADPTTSTTIGSLNQTKTNRNGTSFWQNQYDSSGATTYAAFRQELRHMKNLCMQGVGGVPNLHLTDMITHELYVQALESFHQNPSYTKADLPFDVVNFDGNPVAWDENMVDVQGGLTNCATKGTWYMLNTKTLEMQVQKSRNFATGPFVRPENQDARTAQILLLCALGIKNRRKNGVLFNIARTLT